MSRDPVFGRLESTIANWTDEVTEAHDQLTGQISEARDQLNVLAHIMSERQGESTALKKCREDILTLQDAVRARDTELREARQRQQQLDHKKQSTELDAVRLKKETQTVRIEKNELQRSLDKTRAEADKRIVSLESNLSNQEATIKAHEHSTAADKRQIERLTNSVSTLQTDLAALRNRVAAGKELTVNLQERLEALTHRESQAIGDLSRREAELGELNQLLSAREESLQHSQQELEKREREIASLQGEVESLKSDCDGLRVDNGDLNRKKEDLEHRVRQLADEASVTRQDNEQMIRRLWELRTELTANINLLATTQSALSDLQEEHGSLESELEAFQVTLDKKDQAIGQHEQALSELRARHVTVEVQLSETTATLTETTAREEGLRQDLRDTNERLGVLLRTQEATETQLNETTAALAAGAVREEELRQGLRDTEESLTALQKSHQATEGLLGEAQIALATGVAREEKLSCNLEDTRSALNGAEKRYTKLRKKESDQASLIGDLQCQLQLLTASEAKTRAEREALTSELQTQKEHRRSLEKRLDDSGEELAETKAALSLHQANETALEAALHTLGEEQRKEQEASLALRANLDISDTALQETRQELYATRGTVWRTTEDVLRTNEMVRTLEQTLIEARSTLTQTGEALESSQHTNRTLWEEKAQLIGERDSAITRIEFLENAEKELKTQCDTLTEDCDQLKAKLAETSQNLEGTQEKLALRTRERDEAEDEHRVLEEKHAQFQARSQREFSVLQADLAATRERYTAADSALQTHRAERNSMVARLAELESDRDETLARANDAEERATRLATDLERSQNIERERHKENDTLSAQLTETLSTIETLQASVQSYEESARREKNRTSHLLQQTVSALQSELNQIGGPPDKEVEIEAGSTPSSVATSTLEPVGNSVKELEPKERSGGNGHRVQV